VGSFRRAAKKRKNTNINKNGKASQLTIVPRGNKLWKQSRGGIGAKEKSSPEDAGEVDLQELRTGMQALKDTRAEKKKGKRGTGGKCSRK